MISRDGGSSPKNVDLMATMPTIVATVEGVDTPATFSKLLDDLPRPQKVPLDTDPPIPLWNTWPVLALFLTLLTTEWVLRKRKQLV